MSLLQKRRVSEPPKPACVTVFALNGNRFRRNAFSLSSASAPSQCRRRVSEMSPRSAASPRGFQALPLARALAARDHPNQAQYKAIESVYRRARRDPDSLTPLAISARHETRLPTPATKSSITHRLHPHPQMRRDGIDPWSRRRTACNFNDFRI